MKRIKLGKTEIDQETFECWIAEMGSSQYRANQYELFKHNCNNFSEDVAQFLGNFYDLFLPTGQNFRLITVFELSKISKNRHFRAIYFSGSSSFSRNLNFRVIFIL